MSAVSTLRDVLIREGGSLAAAASAQDEPASSAQHASQHPPSLAASGPRVAAARDEYSLLLEMILEGSLLHYGAPRVVHAPDPDLALLLGDQLYALGLSRLAELGDVEAVAELGDLISLVAQAHAAGDAELAADVWVAAAAAIGWGTTSGHEEAKELARRGDPRAGEALRAAAAAVSGRLETPGS